MSGKADTAFLEIWERWRLGLNTTLDALVTRHRTRGGVYSPSSSFSMANPLDVVDPCMRASLSSGFLEIKKRGGV